MTTLCWPSRGQPCLKERANLAVVALVTIVAMAAAPSIVTPIVSTSLPGLGRRKSITSPAKTNTRKALASDPPAPPPPRHPHPVRGGGLDNWPRHNRSSCGKTPVTRSLYVHATRLMRTRSSGARENSWLKCCGRNSLTPWPRLPSQVPILRLQLGAPPLGHLVAKWPSLQNNLLTWRSSSGHSAASKGGLGQCALWWPSNCHRRRWGGGAREANRGKMIPTRGPRVAGPFEWRCL